MKTKLSGLMDGELADHEVQEVFGALRRDEELRGRWLDYQLIGDALKRETRLGTDLTARVMASLDSEPTVIAPRPSPRAAWPRHAMALAATLAGVAVVGWLALEGGRFAQPETVARDQSVPAQAEGVAERARPASAVAVASTAPQASSNMQEYLIAHEAQSSLLQFRGGTEHIRTVAAVGTAPAK